MTIELIKPIPPQVVNEGASFGPLYLNQYIQSSENASLHFQAELIDGSSLPDGLICTSEGMITGLLPKNSEGQYEVVISVSSDSEPAFSTRFKLRVKTRIVIEAADMFEELKQGVWKAIGQDLPIPEIGELLNAPVSQSDIHYLLERFATFSIWNVYDLNEPVGQYIIDIPNVSPHFNVYDRGSCLVAVPKDLFSHERTLEDALQTARAMAAEAYERGWSVEFTGLKKMMRAAWVELQLLGDRFERKPEIMHYTPSEEDQKIYIARVAATLTPKF